MTAATRIAGPTLPPELLNEWHQFRGGSDGHQWALGRSVADALVEYAEHFSAATLYRQAAKAAECSVGQVRKCSETYAACGDEWWAEFDLLTFEHFATVRYLAEKVARDWLTVCVESADEYGGRPMPAAVLARKLRPGKQAPTFAELVARAVSATTKAVALATGPAYVLAEQALDLLEQAQQEHSK